MYPADRIAVRVGKLTVEIDPDYAEWVALAAAAANTTLPGDLPLRYSGFRSNDLLVGNGIAHEGKHRGLPHIARLRH